MLSCGRTKPMSRPQSAWQLTRLAALLNLSEQHGCWSSSLLHQAPATCSIRYRRQQLLVVQSALKTNSRKSTASDQRKRPRRSSSGKASANPRTVAVRQLMKIQDEGAYIKRVSGFVDADGEDDNNDSLHRNNRAVTELVAGVTRYRRRLDFIITQLTGRAIEKLDPVVREVLRVGVYEMMELGLADHAIGGHVNVAKALGQPHLGGFVNGVLRTAVRKRAAGDFFQPPASIEAGNATADELAIWFSHPTWMVDRWLEQHGFASTVALLDHNNRRPSYGVRVSRGTQEVSIDQLLKELRSIEVAADRSPYLPADFIRIRSGMQRFIQEGYLARGQCQVQDEAAGAVVAFMEPQPGERILDACAAPGGKATFIAQRMRGEGDLMAMDVSASRLQPLRAAIVQQHLNDMIHVEVMDVRDHAAAASVSSPQMTGFDRVLVDVPCSGTGVLAKRADMRWRRELIDLAELTSLQDALLDAAASLVAPGGLLVYSTCSIEPEENGKRVTAFLSRHVTFSLEQPSSGVLIELSHAGMLTIFPHEHGIDGAFAARLRRMSTC